MARPKKSAVSFVHQIFPVLLKKDLHQLLDEAEAVDPAEEVEDEVGVVVDLKIKWLNWQPTLFESRSLLLCSFKN